MTSGCDKFKELMLDLAYDEVDAERADQLREHAAECAGCREELESILLTRKLAAQLPEPEPPTARDAQILELAAEAASKHAEIHHPDRFVDEIPARRPAELERPVPFMDRLRGLLLRPALVTAAVASVVFVISYFVGSHALDKDILQQSAESGAPFVGPAEPMEAADETPPGLGRQPLARAKTSLPGETKDQTVAAQQRLQPAENLGTGGKLKGERRGGSLGTAAPLPQNSAAQFAPPPPALATQTEPTAEEADTPGPADEMDAVIGLGDADDMLAAKSKAAAAPAAPMPQAEEAEAYVGDDARFYRDGMAAYNRGDCATATISLRKVVDPPHDAPALVPSALHHVARCEKRTGRCGRAVVAYEELLNRFPGYKGRAEAMWEAAGCHRRLGHIDQAWGLLDTLAKIPAWRERARTEQQNLKQLKAQD
ncbi:MAG: zf-HC2 domain-containing protein [Deltaproteobacteria bacterium]|nr:zf-HC2 domain-containing protein [Deltaproteobacteria bacterium]